MLSITLITQIDDVLVKASLKWNSKLKKLILKLDKGIDILCGLDEQDSNNLIDLINELLE